VTLSLGPISVPSCAAGMASGCVRLAGSSATLLLDGVTAAMVHGRDGSGRSFTFEIQGARARRYELTFLW